MSQVRFEYPIQSGLYISIPPDTLENITDGYRIKAGGHYIDIPDGYDVWTSEGWVSPSKLINKYLSLDTLRTSYSFSPLAKHAAPASLQVMETLRWRVTNIEVLTGERTKLQIEEYTHPTNPTPLEACICVLLNDPTCGEKYAVPVEVV